MSVNPFMAVRSYVSGLRKSGTRRCSVNLADVPWYPPLVPESTSWHVV
jgi:hypothetical protein